MLTDVNLWPLIGHGQRQQDDQRQVARLDEARANGGQHLVDGEARRQCRADGRDDHDQHGIEAQHEARNDDGHPDKRPEIDVRSVCVDCLNHNSFL